MINRKNCRRGLYVDVVLVLLSCFPLGQVDKRWPGAVPSPTATLSQLR